MSDAPGAAAGVAYSALVGSADPEHALNPRRHDLSVVAGPSQNGDMGPDLRNGDVLRLTCPFTVTEVVSVTRAHANVRWPWWRPDPDAAGSDGFPDGFVWDGSVVPMGFHDDIGLFRIEPPLAGLHPGDRCTIGVPPTVVHVAAVHREDPPLVTGGLPRTTRTVQVLRYGVSDSDPTVLVERGHCFDPDSDVPMTIELLLRPFAFVEPGHDVADADGRFWRFDGPWSWHAHDGGSGVPTWPLTSVAAGEVLPQTLRGSHAAELDRWRAASGAEVPGVGAHGGVIDVQERPVRVARRYRSRR